MKKANYSKSIGLLLAVAMLITVLSACGTAPSSIHGDPAEASHDTNAESSFKIRYELGDEFTDVFTDTPKDATAGDTVELRTEILCDADIHVYVDGQEIGKTHYDSDYWGYSFIMPDKDVLITARFYTKDEIWGTTTMNESVLREKFPEYFDLPTTKGLEVYVWQMAPNNYSCGVMMGTNRNKTLEEMINMKGTNIDEMKVILSTYDIPKEDIIIIPWQNPISSFLGEYWISQKDEDPDSVAKRRQEYIDMLREKLIDSKETGFYDSEFRIQINGQTMNYERYEAGIGSLTPKTVLATFSETTEIEGVVWEVYSTEEYPDLTYVLVISGTNASWTYRIDDSIAPAQKVAYANNFKTAWINYSDDPRLIENCLNAKTMVISSVRHLPIFKFDSKLEIVAFMSDYADSLTFDQRYNEIPSFSEEVSTYGDDFFAGHSLLCVYMVSGSGSFRFGVRDVEIKDTTLNVLVEQTNHPEVGTDDMAGWLLIVEQSKSELAGIKAFDAQYVGIKEGEAPRQLPGHIVYGSFSFEEVKSSLDMSAPTVKTDGFVNVDEIEMGWPTDRAKLEVTADYDLAQLFYDDAADVWKVYFFSSKQAGGSETVYLSGKGVTLLIVYGE